MYWAALDAVEAGRASGDHGPGYAQMSVTGSVLRELLLAYDPDRTYHGSASAPEVEVFVAGLIDEAVYSIVVNDF